MRRNSGHDPDADFRRGSRELADHRPDLAVRSLRAAVDSRSVTQPAKLSRDLYWLALALLRLDRSELAVRSLASAQKLRPRGVARSAYLRRVNDYGMCRRSSPELDDFYAFYSVQACIYLGGKPSRRFDSNSEKDMVTRIIGDAWRSLSCSGALVGLKASRKLAIFKARKIAFPFFGLGRTGRGKFLDVDFRGATRLEGDQRCSCGSGLPFMRCCGRTSAPSERFCE
jgi:hypothetical protein